MSPLWASSLIFFSLFVGSHGRVLYQLPSKQQDKVKRPLQTSRPYNIAHRGSNGEIPEETAAAYMRAIEEGADFIESDILATKDGQLICFHDMTLDATTDIANHSKFANRKRIYEVEGSNMTGYFVVDFTLAELKSLRVKQRYPFRDQQYNGKFSIITFEEFIAIALDGNRIVGIYPEIKDPVFINQRVKWPKGKKFEDKFVETLQKYGYRGAYMSTEWLKQPVFIQSFAPTSLVYISNLTNSPKIFLIDDFVTRTKDTNQSFWDITSDSYLEYIRNYVVGIGPWKDTIVPTQNKYLTTPTDLVERAHAYNLQVHTYTYRNENSYLHFDFHQDPYAEYQYWIDKIGVDGLFTDFTGSLHLYQEWASASGTNEASAFGLLHKISLMISSFKGKE
ncbi:glycerophosphodiester phosphodiesterase GDPD6-like [Zingiber officinale]|uniref:glycerophosphodiester phosphodiesterase GDPD6-like n=1 Tax=Zingiber officinale TaxID=94328 RepID=UPI001C4DACE8|nr:glycerophosphodiester phosphodiesterase GDPD6-like [Zingiber officinale]